MRNQEVAAILALIVVSSIVIGELGLYFKEARGVSPLSAPVASVVHHGSAAITSANVSSSNMGVSLAVKNTGTLDLTGLSPPSVSPGGGDYCHTWNWNPMPATTYPIYSGESIKGNCSLLGSAYRPGLQVVVSVTVTFSDGSTSVLSTPTVVSP